MFYKVLNCNDHNIDSIFYFIFCFVHTDICDSLLYYFLSYHSLFLSLRVIDVFVCIISDKRIYIEMIRRYRLKLLTMIIIQTRTFFFIFCLNGNTRKTLIICFKLNNTKKVKKKMPVNAFCTYIYDKINN